MILKGKARIEFRRWYSFNVYSDTYHVLGLDDFYNLPFSMQIGVLIDWFDSVGIRIEITKSVDWSYWINDEQEQGANWIPTREKARQKAIERAMLIYNER